MVRDWIESKFGTEEVKSLLNEEVYSQRELKKDRKKLQKRRRDLSDEIEETSNEYRDLVKTAAEVPESQRDPYVKQAKIAKQKYKIKKHQYRKNSALMATLISIKGARNLQGMTDEHHTKLESLLHDESVDASDIQDDMFDEMMEFGLTMDTMQEVQDALDFEVMGPDMESDLDEDVLEDVEAVREGKVEAEKIAPTKQEEKLQDEVAETEIEDSPPLEDDLGIPEK